MSPHTAKKVVPWLASYLLLLTLAVVWSLGACSSSDYQTPHSTTTPSALIAPETLKAWSDEGLVNGTGYDRVVILDVNSISGYGAGHIPGAHFVNSADISQNRREGPATDVSMVLDGAHMNALIQKYGINNRTTIVFTGGTSAASAGSYLSVTRAYWTFRYWGFSRERLKLVDGINAAWAAAYGLTTTAPPSAALSAYTVASNRIVRTDLRASLAEVIDVADGKIPNVATVDFRSGETDNSYAGQRGKTAGVFGTVSDFVVFEGRIKGARAMAYTNMFDAANTFRFKSPEALTSLLTGVGINSGLLALVH
jgi:3-mercaptopyruvate sulfurtransferase SseA